jgi:hypothetical protein
VAGPFDPLLRQLVLGGVHPRDGDAANRAVDDVVENGCTC